MQQGSRTDWEDTQMQNSFEEEYPDDSRFNKPIIDISWTTVPLAHSDFPLKNPTVLIFDHYLIIKLHYDEKEGDSKREDVYSSPRKPVVLSIVDLSDDSVQEVAINDKSWLFDQWRFDEAPYSLTKYKDNQIVKFGKTEENKTILTLITIESFRPFEMKSEDIVADDLPDFSRHTAQIHNDFLYLFGGVEQKEKENDLWRFDLKNNSKWELLKTTGKCPDGICQPLSFLYEDNLYVYGEGDSENRPTGPLFMLNLESMSWIHFGKYRSPSLGRGQVDKSMYKGRLVYLNEDLEEWKGSMKLYSWQIVDDEKFSGWLFPNNIKKIPEDYRLTNTSMIYNNYLMTFGTSKAAKGGSDFSLLVYNLEQVLDSHSSDTNILGSREERKFRSLYAQSKFTKPDEAEVVMFRVQDKLIPIHTNVLMKRSKYFAQLLKNDMSGVIDVPDCDEMTFRRFLQFLYCKEVDLVVRSDDTSAINLLKFADKYMQYDLRDKCMEFLKQYVRSANTFQLYDFVCERRIPRFKNLFDKILKVNINVDNIFRVIKYLLECQEAQTQDLIQMNSTALRVLLDNFRIIWENEGDNFEFYEEFLLKNLNIETIILYAKCVYSQRMSEEFQNLSDGKWVSEISKSPLDVRRVLFDFYAKNFKEIQNRGFVGHLPKMFLADLVSDALPK